MFSPFEGQQDQEQVAALDARAAESAGQEESVTEDQSAFSDDSDNEAADDAEDWLGTKDAIAPTSPTSPRKRSRESSEEPSEHDLDYEDFLEPQASPRTRKRLRMEKDRGYPYKYKPSGMFRGFQVDERDEFGEVRTAFPTHFPETLPQYTGLSRRREERFKGRRAGATCPHFPDSPAKPSPLRKKQNAIAADGEEDEDEEEEEEADSEDSDPFRPVFDNTRDYGDDDEDYPSRPPTPSPDDENEGDSNDRYDQDDAALGGDEGDTSSESLRQANGGDGTEEAAETAALPATSTLAVSSEELDCMKFGAWDNEDGDAAFLNAIKKGAPSPKTVGPGSDISTDSLDSPSRSMDSEPSLNGATEELVPLTRQPSRTERVPETGDLSKPRPRNSQLAKVALEEARLQLEHKKLRKALELYKVNTQEWTPDHVESIAAISHHELVAMYCHEIDAKTKCLVDLQKLQSAHSSLQSAHDELARDNLELFGECKAIKQRAEADAEKLALDRAREDIERLAYIKKLEMDVKRITSWAESLDDEAEPARLANEALTAKLEASEKANEALKIQLEASSTAQSNAHLKTRVLELESQIQESAVATEIQAEKANILTAMNQSLHARVAELKTANRKINQAYNTANGTSTPQIARGPLATPIQTNTVHETREEREARWRNSPAQRAAQLVQVQARFNAQDDKERQLRLDAYKAATGKTYEQVDVRIRRQGLVDIVNKRGAVSRTISINLGETW